MGAHRNISRGGQTFGGGPQKICEGGPHIFFRQALKYAYRGGGGVVLMPAEFFLGDPKSIKVDLQNLKEGRYVNNNLQYLYGGVARICLGAPIFLGL